MILTDFKIIRPPYETSQEKTLEWLIDAHVFAEEMKNHPDLPSFRKTIAERLWRVGCKPDKIEKRGHVTADYLHNHWNEMGVYRLNQHPSGENLSVRSKLFEEHTTEVFEKFYPEGSFPPDDLIHVSCTGYVSPSGAQKLVSMKNWGSQTTVTHAYHMGCYASIPAIRMGRGFLSQDRTKSTVDIVHTEICSLHTNPANHNADQLVSQSLFADGFIKYSVKPQTDRPHIRIVEVYEEIIPDSIRSMTWKTMHWGFEMTLAKEIPVLFSRHIPHFLERMAKKSSISLSLLLKNALFAIHPGGPKILLYIQEELHLQDHQMAPSFDILRNYGNMSSATLPHIWEKILNDPKIPSNTLILSLAFGPGLSITGAILEKVCG